MLKFSRKVLCLDWDKRSLRLLLARVAGGRLEIDDAHSHRVPGGVDIDDPQAMGGLLAQSLALHKITQRRVVVDVPREKAVINRLTIPPTPLDELAAAVRFQALKELPFAPDEAQIDYVVLQRDASGMATEVLLAAVRIEVLQRLQATCTAAGLELVRVGLRPYASLGGVRFMPGMAEKRVLLVDVGPVTTEISVFHGEQISFSRSASVSVPFQAGEIISDDSRVSALAERAGVELAEQAESAAVNELVVEITRTLQAYRATEANATLDQIVIAGGTGIEPGLSLAVDRRFGLPTTLYDPTGGLGVSPGEAGKLRAFASVLGLAASTTQDSAQGLDFLSPKRPVPPGQSLKRRLRVYGMAAAIVVVAAAGWVVSQFVSLNRQIGALDKLVNKSDGELTRQVKELAQLDVLASEVQLWRDESKSMVWLDHLLQLTRLAIEPGKQMLVSDLEFIGNESKVRMKIAAASSDVANSFVKQLNEVRAAGKPVYQAKLGTWQDGQAGDARFKGRVDVEVRLIDLRDRTSPANLKAREKEVQKLLDV